MQKKHDISKRIGLHLNKTIDHILSYFLLFMTPNIGPLK